MVYCSSRRRKSLMNKYRAVILVPTVVDFENGGSDDYVTLQARRIAAGMGVAVSNHPRRHGDKYEPVLLECVKVDGPHVSLIDLTAPGAVA